MNDEGLGINGERLCGILTRRAFVRAALASGATIWREERLRCWGLYRRRQRPRARIPFSTSVAIYWSIDLDSGRCVSRERAFGVGHQTARTRAKYCVAPWNLART